MNYIETNSTDPCYNLAFEEYILINKPHGDWLMLWQNDNTIVIGRNQNTAEEINEAFVEKHGITVVRRTTGGGAVYHDLGNLNYSFITDAGDTENMSIAQLSGPVVRALAGMGVKAEVSGRNDIMVDGKKVSGVAQRLYRNRMLHHGTLLFESDPEMISGALNADPKKFSSKSSKSVRARVGNIRDYLPDDMTIQQFWDRLREELSADNAVKCSLTDEEIGQIKTAADEKYRSWDWTYGKSPEYTFRNCVRYPGGTLDLMLNVKNGTISDAAFRGDFMAVTGCEAAAEALRGTRFTRRDFSNALSSLDITAMFGGITLDEICAAAFDDETGEDA